MVFTKTRILSVKVATLATFLSMVKTLDQVRHFPLLPFSVLLDHPTSITNQQQTHPTITHDKRQTSLTQKLVPLLSKIRTKEPAVTVRFLIVIFAMVNIELSPVWSTSNERWNGLWNGWAGSLDGNATSAGSDGYES